MAYKAIVQIGDTGALPRDLLIREVLPYLNIMNERSLSHCIRELLKTNDRPEDFETNYIMDEHVVLIQARQRRYRVSILEDQDQGPEPMDDYDEQYRGRCIDRCRLIESVV